MQRYELVSIWWLLPAYIIAVIFVGGAGYTAIALARSVKSAVSLRSVRAFERRHHGVWLIVLLVGLWAMYDVLFTRYVGINVEEQEMCLDYVWPRRDARIVFKELVRIEVRTFRGHRKALWIQTTRTSHSSMSTKDEALLMRIHDGLVRKRNESRIGAVDVGVNGR